MKLDEMRGLTITGVAQTILVCALTLSPAFSLTAVAADEQPGRDDPRIQLLEAVLTDNSKKIQNLLVSGVSPNIKEEERGPAVVMAATVESYAALQTLVAAPATDLEATNKTGETALMVVARQGHIKSAKALIERGARVDPLGWTPMHLAAGNGHEDIIRLLIESDANINAKSANGTTPLMIAARMGNFTSYEEILKAGADPTPVNDAGLSAVAYLERRGEDQRASLLKAYVKKYKAARK